MLSVKTVSPEILLCPVCHERVDLDQHEYVVALNDAESEQTAAIPTWIDSGTFTRIYGVGAQALRSDADKRLRVTVPPLSTVVYRSVQRIPTSPAAPSW